MSSGRKVKVVTFGCQMNVYDSERLVEGLAAVGFSPTDDAAQADLVILNTCSVREKPVRKVYSELGRLRRLKQGGRRVLLAVAGCVAQQEREALAKRVSYLDLVFGPDHVGEVAELVELAERTGQQVVACDEVQEPARLFPRPAAPQPRRACAFVTVMKGCNQCCAYCIVPHTRGREVSKPPDEVVAEVSSLLTAGVKEVTLLGQNVNRYGMDRPGYPRFHELLTDVAALPGLARLKFVTSHPADMGAALIDCFNRLPNLSSYLHLPLQSGSDAVLARMNRRYTLAHYLSLVERLREARPAIHLSTDLIVGFPGETEEEFEATMQAARRIRWGSAFSFKFSPRPMTAAFGLADDVPAAGKEQRLARLQDVLETTMCEGLARHVGQTLPVLVEGQSRETRRGGARQWTGRTDTGYIVNFAAGDGDPDLTCELVDVTIRGARPHSLAGERAARG